MASRTIDKPKPRIGVDMYTIFEVKSDTAEAITYGDAVTIPGTVEIAPTDNGSTDVFDADNGAYDVEDYLEKARSRNHKRGYSARSRRNDDRS